MKRHIRTIPLFLLMITLLTVPTFAGEIHRAVEAGDADLVADLLAADPALIHDEDQNTTRDLPLHTAAVVGDVSMTRLLLDAGAAVDAGDADRSTPLDVAALNGHAEVVALLLERGADPAFQDDNGAWSLSFAASGAHAEIVTQLIEAGAPLDLVTDSGLTLVHFATMRGLDDLLQRAVAAGVDPNLADNWGRTPLQIATRSGSPEMVNGLLATGADPNRADVQGQTPLIRAAAAGRTDVVEVLIAAGADPSRREARCGRTALHLAALNGYGDVVEILLAGGASVSDLDGRGDTPLQVAERYGHTTAAKALLAAGAVADPAASACPGESACLAACPGKNPAGTALAAGDARLWYLGHSGYAVQTRNNLLVFDYWTGGRAPDEPALLNGSIDPAEIADMNVTVFVSHEHGDHFDPVVFGWADQVASIRYVMGCPAETTVPYELLEPRTDQAFDGVRVRTIASNDSGLGFLVECDGVTVYHAGDHANRLRDFSGPYAAEIDWLAAAGVKPDIALMPVTGCGFGDQEAVRLGVNYALDKLQPGVFIPLHAANNEWRYRDFIDGCRNDHPTVKMVAPAHRGDHYDFRRGSIG